MSLAAVVFDLDETLAVTAREREALLAETADEIGLEPIPYETYERAHHESVSGETRATIFETFIDDETVDAATVAATYREVVNDALVPVDGADSLLTALADGAGYRVGVLTDGPVRAQRSKLAVLGWDDRFDATLVTGAMETRKPDPAVFERILEDLDVAPEQAVYVGDKPWADVEGAKDAGMFAVQVLYPGGPDAHPGADAHVDRDSLAEELPSVLAELDEKARALAEKA